MVKQQTKTTTKRQTDFEQRIIKELRRLRALVERMNDKISTVVRQYGDIKTFDENPKAFTSFKHAKPHK